jgi:hypothetical protein
MAGAAVDQRTRVAAVAHDDAVAGPKGATWQHPRGPRSLLCRWQTVTVTAQAAPAPAPAPAAAPTTVTATAAVQCAHAEAARAAVAVVKHRAAGLELLQLLCGEVCCRTAVATASSPAVAPGGLAAAAAVGPTATPVQAPAGCQDTCCAPAGAAAA